MTPLQYDLSEIEQSIAARFEAQVARHPTSIAIHDAHGALTYDELNRRANRLARALLAQRGHTAPEPIAIFLEHGAAIVIAILAILKAGKFYVPLDLGLPDARLNAILQNSQAPLLITNAPQRARAESFSHVPLLDMDTLAQEESDSNLQLDIAPETFLNLMYTSGTTGEPKGVIQTQRNLLHAIVTTNFPPHLHNEHVAQLTPFSFGGSAAMLFRTFFFGATLHPFNLKQVGLARLAPFLHQHHITRFHTVPSVLRNWLPLLAPDEKFPSLRVIEVGGEPLFKRDLARLFPHVSETCVVRNALGTTETYIAAWNFIDARTDLAEGVVPVGLAPANVEILVLDETGQAVAPGETGEIFVASRFLSPGYWRQPELTHTTFLPSPHKPNVFLYKTGDLGRIRADGALEHLGRQDGMVKIRGHQVVLTFVESAVRALDTIQDAAVLAQPNAQGDQRLVAYLVASNGQNANALRDALAQTLPAHMIPTTFVFLDHLPKLANGKLDRRALPALDDARPALASEYVAPRTPLEIQLAQIWCEVLGIARVGVHDAFLELGGNSLQAAQVVARASRATGVEIPLRAVFDVPTIEGLAQRITQHLAEGVRAQDLEQMLLEIEAQDAPPESK